VMKVGRQGNRTGAPSTGQLARYSQAELGASHC